MKYVKIAICIFVSSFLFLPVSAQDLVAYHIVGNITRTKSGITDLLTMNMHLDAATEINIPYGCKLELLDEASSKRIILSQPGCGSISAHLRNDKNSVLSLSKCYITYIKKQMQNKGLVSKQRYTDFASVTREIDSVKVTTSSSEDTYIEGGIDATIEQMNKEFDSFTGQINDDFDSFREQCNKDYIEFMRRPWCLFEQEEAMENPHDDFIKPVIAPNKRPKNNLMAKKRQIKKEIKHNDQSGKSKAQPNPIGPIQEIEEADQEMEFCKMPFEFYGTELIVRLDETRRINIGEINYNRVADALQHFTTKAYNNLLIDCLRIRKERKLCDWAYFLMLKSLSDQFCGEGTNEATLLLGFLYSQSGYKMRFATDNKRIYMLVASDHIIYGRGPYSINNELFYPTEDISGSIYICEASLPNEKTLSLYIHEQPVLEEDYDDGHEISSNKYPEIKIKFRVNKNLMKFYDNYPSSCIDGNFMTRWMMYANTPMDPSIKKQLYPVLQDKLKGLSEEESVKRILNFVQTGFKYGYDDSIWGGDRAFFAEETLHYPYCDCEDRSILFTRLVRDLLELDCALIYYPKHLAAAVKFTNGPVGTYYKTKDGEEYTICDPTYINASIGEEIPDMQYEDANLIILR